MAILSVELVEQQLRCRCPGAVRLCIRRCINDVFRYRRRLL